VQNHRPIILILGPTAGGKTELSIELANRLPGRGECISADSMQVYRGMDIGTAKPTAAQQARAPHHMIDLVEPDEDGFSVDTWLARAEACIAEVRNRESWPIVVGGTNLYVQALLEGLFDGPAPNSELRAMLMAENAVTLRQRLELVDPAAARAIHPNDRKRTVRAIEVFELSGQPISAMQKQWQTEESVRRNDVFIVGIDYPVDTINRRINARVKAMFEAGLLDEVRLLHAGGRLGVQAREALGYKQLIEHFEGRSSLDDAMEQIKIRSRRYAKQQRTWLRRFRRFAPSIWLDASAMSADELVATAMDALLKHDG